MKEKIGIILLAFVLSFAAIVLTISFFIGFTYMCMHYPYIGIFFSILILSGALCPIIYDNLKRSLT